METQKFDFKRTATSEVILGSDLLKESVSKIIRLRYPKKCAVLTDETVSRWYLQPLLAELRTKGFEVNEIIVQEGEKSKSPETLIEVLTKLQGFGIDRDCPLITLGGGVVGDLGGFAASIYKRGIPLIHMPTTLLSMVDASIGGKTGINFNGGKNLIGTFYQPQMVIMDVSTLNTLPLTQISYGLVEAIKHGAIADSAYYRFILKNTDAIKSKQLPLLQRLVRRSVHIKKSFVIDDETDKGKRAFLNFGHTLGHAFESAGNFRRLHHAEAVGLGMLYALKIANKKKILAEDYTDSLIQLLSDFNLPIKLPEELEKSEILNTISQDKKKKNQEITFILPETLGKVISKQISPDNLSDLLDSFFQR